MNVKEDIDEIEVDIEGVKFLESKNKEGKYILTFEYSHKIDPREKIFNFAVKNKWIILGMNTVETNLEDVFRSLTMEESANA